jgi:hypothetical protein
MADLMELGRESRPSLDSIQLGLLLQTMQKEQPFVDKAMLPIGQTSAQRLQSLHFAPSIRKAGLPSSLAHDTSSSIDIAPVGHV